MSNSSNIRYTRVLLQWNHTFLFFSYYARIRVVHLGRQPNLVAISPPDQFRYVEDGDEFAPAVLIVIVGVVSTACYPLHQSDPSTQGLGHRHLLNVMSGNYYYYLFVAISSIAKS